MMVNSSTKSDFWNGAILARAVRRPASSSARIISRTAAIRASSKNMCSVRHRPMPSAPKPRAVLASSGVSALARTFSLRTLSAQAIRVWKSPVSSGSIMATAPSRTSPLEPSMVMISPALKVRPRAVKVPAFSSMRQFARAGDAGAPHAACHDGRVAGHAAPRRDDAARRVHAVDVLGAGFLAHQDDGVAQLVQPLGLVGVEDDLAGRRAG